MMDFGLSQEVMEKIQGVLADHPAVEKGVLCGSRANGSHKPGSDIDLNLEGEAITPTERDRILLELDDLNLPYEMDVTVLHEISHAPFIEHIERVGVVIYQRGEKIA